VRVVLASDSWGGTLSAGQACAALAQGWRRVAPADELLARPMSDGGPGFIQVLARPGDAVLPVVVSDPLGRGVPATVLLRDGVAYVESAQACGLHLLAVAERDGRGSTAGVALLLRAALGTGAGEVVVGLGGSGTNDGGRGAYEALGAGTPTDQPGGWPAGVRLTVASDVAAPLLGHSGAVEVFGPQKGVTDVAEAEARMAAWADELERRCGRRVRDTDGAGAAGGLGAALLALGGVRVPGVGLVVDLVGLPAALEGADLVITGEGRYDHTSLRAKVPMGVARTAQAAGVPVVVVAGEVDVADRETRAAGVDEVHSTAELAGSGEQSRGRPAFWLAVLGERLARRWSR